MSEDIEIQDELHRLNGLRFCGVWQTEHGDFALFEDALGTRSSFMLKTGETLGEGVERVTARYRHTDSGIAPSIL
jgi:hypothetical protein